jgi:glycosyltransferase involved in cell wall biosynthesis
MRVLQVNRFFANRGGAETVLFQTIGLLQRFGHEVVPFSMEDPSNAPSEYASYFVSNVDLKRRPRLLPLSLDQLGHAPSVFYSREAAQSMEALVRTARPDVAHLHSVYHQLSPSLLTPLRRHGVPTVLTMHDYKLVCPNSILFTGGQICERCKGGKYYNAALQGCVHGSWMESVFCGAESYFHSASGIFRNNIDLYIAPSRFMKQKMTEFGVDGERIVHVPNPLNPGDYSPGSGTGEYIMYAGRLDRAKGVKTLLAAVAGSEMASRVELRIAGDGRERPELEEFCRRRGMSNVRFLGWLSQAELAELHRDALFAVVPSRWYEVFCLAVLEAQAYGKAVIGANIGGIPELIEEGKTGLLFEAGNAHDLRSKIERLLASPDGAVQMGMRARDLVEQKYTDERQIGALLAAYDRARELRHGDQVEATSAGGGKR